MLALHLVILLSVLVFVGCLVVGLVAAGLRALTLWRNVTRFRGALERDLAAVAAQTARLERETVRVSEGAARLAEARARLENSLATAAVLARGAGEGIELVRRIRALWPQK